MYELLLSHYVITLFYHVFNMNFIMNYIHFYMNFNMNYITLHIVLHNDYCENHDKICC